MATILTDANLKKYKTALDGLKSQLSKWDNNLSKAEKQITSGTGATFRTEYAKGKKATESIKSVIDILQSLKTDLNQLSVDADEFYTKAAKAAKK